MSLRRGAHRKGGDDQHVRGQSGPYVPLAVPLSPARRERPSSLEKWGVCWWVELDVEPAGDDYLFTRRGMPDLSDAPFRVYAVDLGASMVNAEGSVPAFEGLRRGFCAVDGDRYPRICSTWGEELGQLVGRALPTVAAEAIRDGLLPQGAEFLPKVLCHQAMPEAPYAHAVLMAQAGEDSPFVFLVVVTKFLFREPPPSCGHCASCRSAQQAPS